MGSTFSLRKRNLLICFHRGASEAAPAPVAAPAMKDDNVSRERPNSSKY